MKSTKDSVAAFDMGHWVIEKAFFFSKKNSVGRTDWKIRLWIPDGVYPAKGGTGMTREGGSGFRIKCGMTGKGNG